jgi:hypothetical protein
MPGRSAAPATRPRRHATARSSGTWSPLAAGIAELAAPAGSRPAGRAIAWTVAPRGAFGGGWPGFCVRGADPSPGSVLFQRSGSSRSPAAIRKEWGRRRGTGKNGARGRGTASYGEERSAPHVGVEFESGYTIQARLGSRPNSRPPAPASPRISRLAGTRRCASWQNNVRSISPFHAKPC